jgi:hypothetical protein
MMRATGGKRPRRLTLAIIVIVGTVVLLALAATLFRSPLRSLSTFRQVDDYPLYVMHIYQDYRFADLLEGDIPDHARLPSSGPAPTQEWACTCFATLNGQNQAILGRNFDWLNQPTLLLFTHPSDGYASVSLVDISYLGFGTGAPSWLDRIRLLEAP